MRGISQELRVRLVSRGHLAESEGESGAVFVREGEIGGEGANKWPPRG